MHFDLSPFCQRAIHHEFDSVVGLNDDFCGRIFRNDAVAVRKKAYHDDCPFIGRTHHALHFHLTA